MRALIISIILVYLVGIGVTLFPTLSRNWDRSTGSELTAIMLDSLPIAMKWPVRVYHRTMSTYATAG
jgi:hypothetical protein